MRAFAVLSTLVAVAVSGVLATPESPATLFARQATALPEVPAQCKSACAVTQSMTSCGSDLSCMCSTKMGQGLVDCGNCGLDYFKNDPSIETYKSQFASGVKAYQDSCAQAGYPVGQLTVGSSSSSSSSGSGSGSSSSSSSGGSSGSTSTGSTSASGNGAASMRAMTGAGALVGAAVVMAMI